MTGERLTASYLYEVTQRTGEDWPSVRLVLSTARPGLHRGLPELRPWYIKRREPAPPDVMLRARGLAMQPGGPDDGAAGVAPGAHRHMSASLRDDAPLTAEVTDSGVNQVYEVARPIAVPADGNPPNTTTPPFHLNADIAYLPLPILPPQSY